MAPRKSSKKKSLGCYKNKTKKSCKASSPACSFTKRINKKTGKPQKKASCHQRKIHTGSKGGRYFMKKGRKVYI